MTTRWRMLGRIGAVILFFLTTFWLSIGTGDIVASPDEHANLLFAEAFGTQGTLCLPEEVNGRLSMAIVHPRSTLALQTCIVPSSFLGMPVFAGIVFHIGAVFGIPFAIFLVKSITPVAAIVCVGAVWWLVRRMTGKEGLADLSAFFLMIHPAFWYYTARTMMPNVLFVSLTTLALAGYVVAHDRQRAWLAGVAGLVFGIGVSFRLVELPLIFVLICLSLVVFRKQVSWRLVWSAVFGFGLVMGGYLALNNAVYGNALVTGYTVSSDPGILDDTALASHHVFSALSSGVLLLLPFGFHPRAILRHVLLYGVWLYPVLSLLSAIGMMAVMRHARRGWRFALALLLLAAVWLGVVYGSWAITDNIDPRAVTVGNSYVRYWLPLFVASSVFSAYALFPLLQKGRVSRAVAIGVLGACVVTSVATVFGGSDGLLATRRALLSYADERSVVLQEVGCSSEGEDRPIVIVDHADKYLFPDCRVVVPLRSDDTYNMLPELFAQAPLYYFGLTLPEDDVTYLNTVRLAPFSLRFVPFVSVGEKTVYRIVTIDEGI